MIQSTSGYLADHLISRLQHFTRLSPEDRAILGAVTRERTRRFAAREDIVREGDRPQSINVVLDGWACRYKHLDDGRRQIVAFLLPGDLCDLNVFVLRQMDHSIGALTPVVMGQVTREAFERMAEEHSRILHALWWDALVAASIQREWTVSLGQRNAFERMAHLFCELFVRLRMAGVAGQESFPLPITQLELSEALGLSSVHVNRTLREMRSEDLVSIQNRELVIHDVRRLMDAASFNPDYLHVEREGALLDAEE